MVNKNEYDFCGWATRNNIKCSDGRTIIKDAFKDNDGGIVPLVWDHDHKEAENVLGHALLENRDEGVYAYCSFNGTQKANLAKELVNHGDIFALSIFANQLKQNGGNVMHGAIREVSLVLAGANPGAYIENVIAHSAEDGETAIIYNDEKSLELYHADEGDKKVEENKEETKKVEDKKSEDEETVEDVFNTLNEKQKAVFMAMLGSALEQKDEQSKEGEDNKMIKHNAFEGNETSEQENELIHSELASVIADGKRYGSLKESFEQHSENLLQHGITNIDYLFPDSTNLTKTPGFINTNPLAWVTKVMNGVHHTPFSRIKMMFADITADEARARGYIKGNQKVDETFSLLKRKVDPTTIYKKQSMDRDDVIDITDFDVVSWLKSEMRLKLDEELARAFLFGDGRSSASNDKIDATKIIPIYADTTNNLYAISKTVTPASGETLAHAMIDDVMEAMNDYEGSGNTIFFTTPTIVTQMLQLEDANGIRLYKSINEVATAMTVGEIIKVPASIVPSDCYGIVVDLNDYNVGADKGGSVNMFDDFDIDYNKQKYLIETRCSGALIKPHSAIVLKKSASAE